MKAHTCVIGIMVVVACGGVGSAQQAPPTPTPVASDAQARVNVTAVRVLVRARTTDGKPVQDLRADEFEVMEDGEPADVLSIERLAGVAPATAPTTATGAPPTGPTNTATPVVPVRVAIYLVPEFSFGGDLPRLLESARAQADRLLALGPVTVVLANPEPKVVADSIISRVGLDRALAQHLPTVRQRTRITKIRRDFIDEVGTMGSNIRAKLLRARIAILDERAVLEGVLGRLMGWGRSQPRGMGFLLLGMGGFDGRVSEFYLRVLEPGSALPDNIGDYQRAQVEFRQYDVTGDVQSAAAALAERGWSVVTFDSGQGPVDFAAAASESGYGRLRSFVNDQSGPPGVPPQPRKPEPNGTGDLASDVAQSFFLYPMGPLRAIAETTGGMLLKGAQGGWPTAALGSALDELGHSLVLTYQVDRPADGRPHPLDVRVTRAGVTLTAPQEVFSGTPEGEAVLRAQRALAGTVRGGELPVTLTFTPEPTQAKGTSLARLQVKVDLGRLREALETLGGARFRVTMAVEIKGREPFITHDEKEVPLGEGSVWTYEAPIQWQPGATRIAVVAEELATGVWGVAKADLPRAR